MKNKLLILIAMAALMTACGTTKKATTLPTQPGTPSGQTTQPTVDVNPIDAIITTLGGWQTMQTGGNIKLSAGSSFSSAIQVRMVRDQAIYISLRPLLGIEAGKLIITADSLYAIDKVHKRYIAEKVSILTSGIPVTVSDVQDIFLGRPCIIGKGTLSQANRSEMTSSTEQYSVMLTPSANYMGYVYSFIFDKSNRITSLDIAPEGSSTAAYKVKYSDVKATKAGNIAHSINANATIEKKKLTFSLTYKDIDWNGDIKIDRSLPKGYTRMSARDLFSMFAN